MLLSGCVSAIDETSAFGFAPNAVEEAKEVAEAEGEVAAEGAEAEQIVADAATSEAAAEVAVAGGEAAEASGNLALAASLQAETPRAASAFAASAPPSRASERSLYASLFTESEARTPIRNTDNGKSGRVVVTQTDGHGKPQRDAALPGVDPSSLFEIGQRASVDDEDLLDDIGGSYQVASLSGMARLAPNGFLVQRDDIVTNCFGTELVGLLRQVENRFNQKVVITSGYRSPSHNRRVNGAKASMHMACKAADLHVPGVDGKTVAAFVRSLPRRGGVGTYCHTAAIHVDVGQKRDWNWACRRRQNG
ncbi:YcbK family protein [Aureimonas populi]|uniref:Murein endopeptidase K n=1 Tax=Aureimonas populi TaxID=1701758 RepID=A0ABW5CMJ2_9HYPH|nr:D-Ala-D-Ala carboxypeptidase family metallohydrolase [Aureimonas populi]